MSSDGDIQVGIISSRPTLDLAINTWLPGYRARSSTDLDVVVDLTQDGGVIVIDLLQGEGPELIRELRDRGVDRPIVVLASESQTYEPPMSGDVIVANSATIEELSAAFGEARARHRSRALLDAGGVGRRPGTEHQAAAGPHRSGGASTDQAVFDLRGTPIPRTPNAMTSEDNKTRTKDVTPPFGLKFGRRSRRARALLQDAVVDVHTERADTGTSPASRTDQGSPPIDTEPLEVIDLTEPLFRSGDRRAGASGRSVPRDASRPPIPTTESSPSAPTAASTAPAPRVGSPADTPATGGPPARSTGSATSPIPGAGSPVDAQAGGNDRTRSRLVDAWSAARAWVILDELETIIGSGSGIVAVPTSERSYRIVAGIGIAPSEARRSIPIDHPVLAELQRSAGWFVRPTDVAHSRGPRLPLAECVHLLALSVPGTRDQPAAIVIIGRHEPFDVDEAAGAAAIVQDGRHLDAHLRRLQTPGTELMPTAGRHPVGEQVVRAGWQVLDDLFCLLDGAAAAVTFRDRELYAVSAAVRVDPGQAGRAVSADHALLKALRHNPAGVIVRAASDERALVAGLPLPRAPFVAGLPLGDAASPHGVALLSHHRRIEPAELERWRAILATHPVHLLEA